uniref:GG17073 n=1 Tax=Drosophila erecta TaxID=7220 RepID=B3P174_DROER
MEDWNKLVQWVAADVQMDSTRATRWLLVTGPWDWQLQLPLPLGLGSNLENGKKVETESESESDSQPESETEIGTQNVMCGINMGSGIGCIGGTKTR